MNRKVFFTVFLLLLLITNTAAIETSKACMKVHFLDVGEGNCTWIETAENQHILIDTGNPVNASRIVDRLREAGVERLAALIITHPHADHMGGVFQILARFKIDKIYDNGQPINLDLGNDLLRWYVESVRRRNNYEVLTRGVELDFGVSSLKVLWPPQPSSPNWNDNALVIRVETGDESILLMADAGKCVERALLEEGVLLRASVLQVGHHGARDASSRTFLETVNPDRAVISINRNNIRGYPAAETLALLKKLKIDTFITWRDGSYTWSSEGNNFLKKKSGLSINPR